jgi:hypothetical protein
MLAGIGYAVWRTLKTRLLEPPAPIDWEPAPFPFPPVPRPATSAASAASAAEIAEAPVPAPASEPAPTPAPASTNDAWVEPDDGVCPASHPVKAKLRSGIFHVPGGQNYDRTHADRCYLDADAAQADGLRQSQR